jgi:putative phage-type endonuclease
METVESEVQEWQEERAKGVGGSEAAAVMGLSKYKTPYQVWQDKMGLSGEREESGPLLWGKLLEPLIRQRYSDVTGRSVLMPRHLKHEKYPFVLGTLDGITEDKRVLEIKTSRWPMEWGEPGTDEIPQAYIIQVQQYLAITGYDVADVAALIGGSDFRIYSVEADKELQDMIIDREAEFWRMVESETPPEPVSYADAVKRYRTSVSQTVTASAAAAAAYESLKAIKEQYKAIEQSEETAKTIIMKELGEADTLISVAGDPLVTWKKSKDSKRFDAKKFQADHPDLYDEYSKTQQGTRRFLLK